MLSGRDTRGSGGFIAVMCFSFKVGTNSVATLTWPTVGVKPNTWKSWDLESTGTPECSELDNKGKNTSH